MINAVILLPVIWITGLLEKDTVALDVVMASDLLPSLRSSGLRLIERNLGDRFSIGVGPFRLTIFFLLLGG